LEDPWGALLSATKDVNGGFVIVVPRADIPGVNRDSPADDATDARRAQDAHYTASLPGSWGSVDKSAAFALPDLGRWPNPYWDSMKDIAGFIADLAGKADLLPRADAVAVFEEAASWAAEQNDQGLRGPIPMLSFFLARVRKWLRQTQASLIDKYSQLAEEELSKDYRAFEIDLNATVDEAAGNATDELLTKFEALPRALRAGAYANLFDVDITDLRSGFTKNFERLVMRQRSKLKREFVTNCSRASRTVVNAAMGSLNWWRAWDPRLKEKFIIHFSDAVNYNDLPMEMQGSFEPRFRDWSRSTAREFHHAIEAARWISASAILTLVLLACLTVPQLSTIRTHIFRSVHHRRLSLYVAFLAICLCVQGLLHFVLIGGASDVWQAVTVCSPVVVMGVHSDVWWSLSLLPI
jgi:hypothetical protein